VDEVPETDHGVASGVLRPGEVVSHRWSAPGGLGLLTDRRCLLLSHPHPVHRSVRWAVDLERVNGLAVEPVRGPTGSRVSVRGSVGGGFVTSGAVDPTFCVLVNRTIVFVGNPDPCADLQRRIDDARTSRCMARYGRLLPYRPGPPTGEDQEPQEIGAAADEPSAAATQAGAGTSFLLFVAGVPFGDVPGAETSLSFGVFWGGLPLGTDRYGGHEPADRLPGQMYGDQAEIGRMVLDLARKCGVSVKVIDVDRSGADLGLVQKWVSPNDELPVLVRPDGARLAGSEAMVPATVAEFLQGP
jgi:hypothetical protein